MVEYTTARPATAGRAESASTRAVTAICRRSLRATGPISTRCSSHDAPARRTSPAKVSSERTSPGVVPSETSAMSGTSVKGRDCTGQYAGQPLLPSHRAETPGIRGGSDVEPRCLPRGRAGLARRTGARRRIRVDRRRRRLPRPHARCPRGRRSALPAAGAAARSERGAERRDPGGGGRSRRDGRRRRLGAARLAGSARGRRGPASGRRRSRRPDTRPPRGARAALLRARAAADHEPRPRRRRPPDRPRMERQHGGPPQRVRAGGPVRRALLHRRRRGGLAAAAPRAGRRGGLHSGRVARTPAGGRRRAAARAHAGRLPPRPEHAGLRQDARRRPPPRERAARARGLRLAHAPARLPPGLGGGRALGRARGGGGAPAVTGLPEPESFLSGEHGEVGGRRATLRRAADRVLDGWLRASGAAGAIDDVAERVPARDVLVASVYRGPTPPHFDELESSSHRVERTFGSLERLGGGKFENLNALVEGARADWLAVVDDDVLLPARFLDRMIALCEAFDLALAQPAQSLASHAAWRVPRRRPFSILRETRFVEIGPAPLFRRAAAAELLPFPPLRYGWGLDLAWSATALA